MRKYVIGTLVVLAALFLGISSAYAITRVVPASFIRAQNSQFYGGRSGIMGRWRDGNRQGQAPYNLPRQRGFPPRQGGPGHPDQNDADPGCPGMGQPGQPRNYEQPGGQI